MLSGLHVALMLLSYILCNFLPKSAYKERIEVIWCLMECARVTVNV